MNTHVPLAWFGATLLPLLAGVCAGCANALGPERLPVVPVFGVVTEGGRPLSQGWIEFFPVDGTVGKLRSARLGKDGSFQADKVPVGRNLIRLVNADIETPGADRVFGAYHSPLRRVIPAQPGPPLKIDLLDEWIRYAEPRAQKSAQGALTRGERR
jgi:hypothetical protein